MKPIIIYILALTAIFYISWEVQEIHLGIGYAIGTVGILIAFFLTVNSLSKRVDK